jgi:hypothetical protein
MLPMPSERFLSTKQIAAELGCHPKTVSRLFHAGKLPEATKFGNATAPITLALKDLPKVQKRFKRRPKRSKG